MTPENFEIFRRHEDSILACMRDATTNEERRTAGSELQKLHKMATQMQNPYGENPPITVSAKNFKAARKPKLTTREKYDKKNSRREAIMAQRERHANA